MAQSDLTLRLGALDRGPVRRRYEPDQAERAAIARELDLRALDSLVADITARPWLDGAEIDGRFTAVVTQVCGVSLDPFQSELKGGFKVRVVPAGSPNAPVGEGEEIDPEADDPPDVLEDETVDLKAYVIEHLALEIDPFPRKPGAVFEPPTPEEEASPFAVLKTLKDGPKN